MQQAYDVWGAIPTATLSYVQGAFLPVDVDITNFVPYFLGLNDGLSAIVFDDDGQIFEALFGPNTGVLGFAGPEFGIGPPQCIITEGLSFLNGPAFSNLTAALDVMVHEFGHFTNFAHTVVNGQIYLGFVGGDDTGPTPNDSFGPPPNPFTDVIETMYPFYYGPGIGTQTLHADDVAIASTMYPALGFFDNTGTITGTIFAPNGTTKLTGVNVIARNFADPFYDAVSAISSDFTDSLSQADPFVGVYTINGLTPGADYGVYVDEILAGGFSTPPLTPLPGPEEGWNGADESSDPDIDDPAAFVAITAIAGSPATGIDVIFNQPGEGDPLPVGDDGFVSLFLPFSFTICDQDFQQVFVNANGNLTFGTGDTDFTESASEFLDEAPRIAGLWDDLNPSAGGSVFFTTTNNTFSVTWDGVPEFFATGSNTFTITLKKDSDEIVVDYGNIDASDGLAGVSCGFAVTGGVEQPTELVTVPNSRTINFNDQTAIYELGAGSDLDFYSIRYANQQHPLMDKNEPNDSIAKATSIDLPFNTAPNDLYTAIDPPAGDVDYYGLTAEEGDTLIAETVRGDLDTVIGIFDSNGALLNDPVADDDTGVNLLSRAEVSIPADGTYYVAVSFCCDYDLDGVDPGQGLPFDGGRYVLDVVKFAGTPIILGDDDFEEVALDFTFPYQGSDWNSVYVNSNGSLTFGAGDTDFTESVSEFLNENPRIAPLWDDLSPNQGGLVLVDSDASSFTVSFSDVPQFVQGDSNNFAVTLLPDGTVTITYGTVDANDGIVGVTEGGGAADPGETDLSAGGPYSAVGTTYEQFTGDFDLDGATLDFNP